MRWAQSLVKEWKHWICEHVLQHEMGSISILERSRTHSGHYNKAWCPRTFGNRYKPKNKSTKYICRDGFKIINKRGQGRRISFKIKLKLNKDKTPGYPEGPELPCFWSPIKLCVFPAQKELVSIVKLIIYLLHCLITLHVSFDLWNQQQKNLSIHFLWGAAFLISTFFF